MSKAGAVDLKRFIEKRMLVKVNGNRRVSGLLRGYDQYLNIVLDGAIEEISNTERRPLGPSTFIRGSSILTLEPMILRS